MKYNIIQIYAKPEEHSLNRYKVLAQVGSKKAVYNYVQSIMAQGDDVSIAIDGLRFPTLNSIRLYGRWWIMKADGQAEYFNCFADGFNALKNFVGSEKVVLL